MDRSNRMVVGSACAYSRHKELGLAHSGKHLMDWFVTFDGTNYTAFDTASADLMLEHVPKKGRMSIAVKVKMSKFTLSNARIYKKLMYANIGKIS